MATVRRPFALGLVVVSLIGPSFEVRAEGLTVSQLQVSRSSGEQWRAQVAWKVPWQQEPYREVHDGVPIDFTVTLRVFRERGWWYDEEVATTRVQREIYYNRLTNQYRVIDWEEGDRYFTRDWGEARELVRETGSIAVAGADRLREGEAYYLGARVQASREQLSLPARMLAVFGRLFKGASDWRYQPLEP